MVKVLRFITPRITINTNRVVGLDVRNISFFEEKGAFNVLT